MAQDCYILTVEGDQHEFMEVAAEMVDIGFEIPAFVYNSKKKGDFLEFWRVHDLASGLPVSRGRILKGDAVWDACKKVVEEGFDAYMIQQKIKLDRYGKSPAAGG